MLVRENGQTCRILLADSSDLLCEQVTAMLADVDCELVTVRDGFEVLCRLPGIQPDLLLISSELPRLSGLQVCSLLRQSPDFSSLPVVLMLNTSTAVETARATLAGASACLPKPFRRKELEAVLAGLSDNPGLSDNRCVLTAVA